jgi:hypothetical protein
MVSCNRWIDLPIAVFSCRNPKKAIATVMAPLEEYKFFDDHCVLGIHQYYTIGKIKQKSYCLSFSLFLKNVKLKFLDKLDEVHF